MIFNRKRGEIITGERQSLRIYIGCLMAYEKRVDAIPCAVFGLDKMNSTQLGNTLVSAMSRLRPIDAFYPDQKPLPGINECRFCGKDFAGMQLVADHAEKGGRAHILTKANKMIEGLDFPRRCTRHSDEDVSYAKTDFESSKARFRSRRATSQIS